jgi:hypothetical protein
MTWTATPAIDVMVHDPFPPCIQAEMHHPMGDPLSSFTAAAEYPQTKTISSFKDQGN